LITSSLGFKVLHDPEERSIHFAIAFMIREQEVDLHQIVQAYYPNSDQVDEYHDLLAKSLNQSYEGFDKSFFGDAKKDFI
jgi:hypothetical protein